MTRLSRIVEQNRQRLRTDINYVVLKTAADIAKEGNTLASAVDVGNETKFKEQNELAINNLNYLYKQAQENIVNILKTAVEKLQQDIQELHQNSLLQELVRLDDSKVSRQINSKITQTKIGSGTKLNNLLNSLEKGTPAFGYFAIVLTALGQSAINQETWNKMYDANQALKEALDYVLQLRAISPCRSP